MNAIQIKNHLDDFDKHYPFRKLVMWFGVLPTSIFFPINFFFNPNVSSIVKDSPVFLGFGVLAFIAMFLVLSIGGVFLIRISVEGYLAYGRFNTNSMLVDDQAPREFARRSKKYLFEELRSRFEPIFEEIKQGFEHKISEQEKLTSELSRRFNIKSSATDYRVAKLEREVRDLKAKLEEYKNKDSTKKQQIGENIDAQDLNENTKIDDEHTKFKSRD